MTIGDYMYDLTFDLMIKLFSLQNETKKKNLNVREVTF